VERIRALLDSYPERTSLMAEVSVRLRTRSPIADSYVDAPDQAAHGPTTSSPDERGAPLIAPAHGIIERCRPNSRAESLLDRREPTTFPASPPAGTGL